MAVKLRKGAIAHVKRVAKNVHGKTLTTAEARVKAVRRTRKDLSNFGGHQKMTFDFAGDDKGRKDLKGSVRRTKTLVRRTMRGTSPVQQGSGDSTTGGSRSGGSRIPPGRQALQKGAELAASRKAARMKGSGSPSRDFKGGPMGARNTRKIMKEERYLRHNPDGTARVDVERKPIQERRPTPKLPDYLSKWDKSGKSKGGGLKGGRRSSASFSKKVTAARTSRTTGPTGMGMY